jgi:hypothetical protein
MHKLTFSFLSLSSGLLFTGCVDEDYGYYDDRPGYYAADYGPDVDFYYVSSRPYSRSYGPLYLRDGRYYYSRGGSYVIYDRPTRVYRSTNYRVVNRDVNVRNVRYNNERVVRNYRTTRDYDRGDRTVRQYDRRTDYRQRSAQPTQLRVSTAPGHRTDVRVVEKKKKKKHED